MLAAALPVFSSCRVDPLVPRGQLPLMYMHVISEASKRARARKAHSDAALPSNSLLASQKLTDSRVSTAAEGKDRDAKSGAAVGPDGRAKHSGKEEPILQEEAG